CGLPLVAYAAKNVKGKMLRLLAQEREHTRLTRRSLQVIRPWQLPPAPPQRDDAASRDACDRILAKLTTKERLVCGRLAEGATLVQIAHEMGVSDQRVGAIRNSARAQLKRRLACA